MTYLFTSEPLPAALFTKLQLDSKAPVEQTEVKKEKPEHRVHKSRKLIIIIIIITFSYSLYSQTARCIGDVLVLIHKVTPR